MNSPTNTINPKSCLYGCGLQIYWNAKEKEYWEVFTTKKHICPNRSTYNKKSITQSSTAPKPTYYKKPFVSQQSKPKMDNSFQLLTGSVTNIQKQYEILSDIVRDHNGKVHGSQSHIIAANNTLQLIVYYEVLEGQRDEVKRKFAIFIRNTKELSLNQTSIIS
jgi:hypothetical protein